MAVRVTVLLSTKSTIQLSRSVMINSESMGIEEASRSDVRVSKHLDLDVNERWGVANSLVVPVGGGGPTAGVIDGGSSDLSLRLNVNFGFVPVDVWFICSFSKARSHDLSCLNTGRNVNDHVRGYRVKFVPFQTVAGRKGEEMGVHPRTAS